MRKNLRYLIILPLFSIFLVNCDDDEIIKPIEIETKEVVRVDFESAVVTGKIIEFGKGIDAFGHCWSTNPIPSINDDTTIVAIEIGGDYQSDVTGLIDGEKYYFRSYALNEDEIVYGEIKEFTTVLYGLPIVELQIDSVQYESVNGIFKLIDFGGYDQINKIGICISTSTNPTINDSIYTINVIDTVGIYNFHIEELIDGQTYYLKAFAVNDKGISYSIEKDFATISYELPIVELQIGTVDYGWADGYVNLISLGGYDQINKIGICISTSTNPTINDSIYTINVVDTVGIYSFHIAELIDGQTYYLKAFAVNNKGVSYSIENGFLTLEYRLPEILMNSVTDITNNSFNANIQLLDFGGCDSILNYGLCWSEMENPTIESNIIELGSTIDLTEETIFIENLDSFQVYYVRAFVTNKKGVNYSSEQKIRTEGTSIVQNGLVACYLFDGDVNDYSENQNNATNYGAILATDRFGNLNSAYIFDGSNDYMSIDHTESLNFDSYLNSYTLSFWVKGSTGEVGPCRIIEKWNELIGTPYPFSIAATSTVFKANIRTPENYFNFDYGNLWDNNWKYIVLIVNSENKVMYGYVNNSLIASTSYSSLGATGNTTNIYLGGHPALSNRYFKGHMDDIRIYNRALTEDEIQALYHENGWDN